MYLYLPSIHPGVNFLGKPKINEGFSKREEETWLNVARKEFLLEYYKRKKDFEYMSKVSECRQKSVASSASSRPDQFNGNENDDANQEQTTIAFSRDKC